jgi:Xaa-Pro dipeptidase
MSVYEDRREKIYDWMIEEGIALVMFEDFEARRDPAIRWMTGQPGDSLLFLSVEKQSLLIPWDINLAMLFAEADILIPYAEFERNPIKALRGAAESFKISPGAKLEIPPVTSYPLFLQYVEAFTDFDIVCRHEGAHREAGELRAIKDEAEIEIYRHVSAITNDLITVLEQHIRTGTLQTEGDVALFIEAESRNRGCEGTGFETLAAGPQRSFGIHPFPAYTGGPFATQGLSILDFGVRYEGYTSDVTLTFARPPLSRAQERVLNLTERAYRFALNLVEDGIATRTIAAGVDNLFEGAKKRMPHGLGHGIGLEAHEFPLFHNRSDNTWTLKPGMIFTLEPGLYDPVQGGCRLENDILLTESGAEVLTNARIIRL